jgi:hypothetical protein
MLRHVEEEEEVEAEEEARLLTTSARAMVAVVRGKKKVGIGGKQGCWMGGGQRSLMRPHLAFSLVKISENFGVRIDLLCHNHVALTFEN